KNWTRTGESSVPWRSRRQIFAADRQGSRRRCRVKHGRRFATEHRQAIVEHAVFLLVQQLQRKVGIRDEGETDGRSQSPTIGIVEVAEAAGILIEGVEAQVQMVGDGSADVKSSTLKVVGAIGELALRDEIGFGFLADGVNDSTGCAASK